MGMGVLQFYPNIFSATLHSSKCNVKSYKLFSAPTKLGFSRDFKLNVVEAASASEVAEPEQHEEPPSIDFGFVSPKLFPDGSPDVQIRSAVGGQKLRDIMLDGYIDLYGPYEKPLFNCGGGGTCGTCMVEVVEGKQLLSPRTEKEKEKLKRKPKTWRLACQTIVGTPESRGQVIIQQLPEWKVHEWK